MNTTTRMTTKTKLSLWAPATPGAPISRIGDYETLDQARAAAQRFAGRKDLRSMDVFIRLGRAGKIIERCGPAR